jgi:hypothetical protein
LAAQKAAEHAETIKLEKEAYAKAKAEADA